MSIETYFQSYGGIIYSRNLHIQLKTNNSDVVSAAYTVAVRTEIILAILQYALYRKQCDNYYII